MSARCFHFVMMVIVCSLVGCALRLPERQDFSMNLPGNWSSGQSFTNDPIGEWWESLGNTELTGLVKEALVNNPNLQMTAVRLEQARLRARIAGADRRPTLNASLDAGKKRSNFIGLPIGGTSVLTSRSENYGFTLSSNWELDVWGRIRAGQLAASMDTAVAQAELAAAQQSLAAQTVKAWLALTEAREQLGLALARLAILDLTVRQADLRYGLGVGPALDLRLAETNLAAARATVEQWRSPRAQAQRQLEVLLGRYPTGALAGVAALPDLPPPIPVGLPSQLLTRRPDILGAHGRLIAADARIAVARAELYPKFSLTASGGSSSDELENLLNNHLLVWSLGSNLTQPILNAGRLRAKLKLRESYAAEAVIQYRSIVLNAFAEVEITLANEQLLTARESRLAESAGMAAQALVLAEDRFARGLEPFIRVLETQRRVNGLQSQQVGVRRLCLENRVNLHLALGGSFGIPKNATKEAP
ncbi:MAG: efflux transporter outer membrane subunit [Verrucomicrobiales bacterium]|nr:efflux transporter outer membrane subunit [Verrucomicrobiales bacterium]MBT5846270.1 efflux transporter outer membrane subunit [Verrucomicrobiales bacterium]